MKRTLDLLVKRSWRHLGEVPDIVHPRDMGSLLLLAFECRKRLKAMRPSRKRERLVWIASQLETTIILNELLPLRSFIRVKARSSEEYRRRIKLWLAYHDMSQADLARVIATDPSNISRVINGKSTYNRIPADITKLTGIAPPERS